MVIYFAIAVILIVGMLFDVLFIFKITSKVSAAAYVSFVVLLIIFAGTREYIGYDYVSYQEIFRVVHTYVGKGYTVWDFFTLKHYIAFLNIEPLYLMLNVVCDSYADLLLIMASLGVGIKSYVIYKKTNYKFFCLFLYYCEMYLSYEMGIMRQGVAMGFMMLALFSLREQKNRNYFIYTILATGFHFSSLLMLPMYFIYKINYKSLFAALVPSVVFFIVDFKQYLVSFSKIFLTDRIATKFLYHIKDIDLQYGLLARMFLILVFLVFAYRHWNFQREQYVFINCFIYGVILALMFYHVAPGFVARGTFFFYFSYIFVFDLILAESKSKWFARIISCSVISLGIWHIYALLERNYGIYYPYVSSFLN